MSNWFNSFHFLALFTWIIYFLWNSIFFPLSLFIEYFYISIVELPKKNYIILGRQQWQLVVSNVSWNVIKMCYFHPLRDSYRRSRNKAIFRSAIASIIFYLPSWWLQKWKMKTKRDLDGKVFIFRLSDIWSVKALYHRMN